MGDLKVLVLVLLAALRCGGSGFEPTDRRSVLVGSQVILHCRFDRGSELLEPSALTVEWNVVDRREEKSTVYTFEDGRAHVNRRNCVLNDSQLLRGDASLLLHDVTVGNEGLYTCRVITPVVYTETTALEVLARPSMSLPEKAEVAEGEEKTIQCDVSAYYPEKVDVMWRIANSSHTLHAGFSQFARACTELATHNPDGTYSIRSGITLHSSAVTDGGIHVICQVEHQTYNHSYSKSVMLTVRAAPAQPAYSAGTLITVSSVMSLLLAASVTGGVFLLYRYFGRAAPSISQISQADIIYANVPTELKCTVQGVSLKRLKVRWLKEIPGGSLHQGESVPLLLSQDVSDQARLLSHGKHHIAVLSVCVPVTEDVSRYQCEVTFSGSSFRRQTTVRVKVKPSFLQISSIPQIPTVERLLVLCCRVENFYPKDIYLEWSRNDGEEVHTVTDFGPFSDHNQLYSMWSKIQLLMAREDERAVYTCRVYHCSFSAPGYEDILYHINTQGTPPQVMFIDSEPLCPLLNQECTLHLCIKDFCPQDVSVTWTKDGEAVLSGVFNTPPSLNVNGLYSMFSFLKLTPSQDDEGCRFRCQVVHSAQREPEERVFTLSLHARHT
ncbi:unnamed protein product [Ophioblennius macclurei]